MIKNAVHLKLLYQKYETEAVHNQQRFKIIRRRMTKISLNRRENPLIQMKIYNSMCNKMEVDNQITTFGESICLH